MAGTFEVALAAASIRPASMEMSTDWSVGDLEPVARSNSGGRRHEHQTSMTAEVVDLAGYAQLIEPER